MIDLHCHIPPGVDDGPATLEDSIALARAALLDGKGTVVATPHMTEGTTARLAVETRERASVLAAELSQRGIQLQLFTGLEVYLTRETPWLYGNGQLLTLNGSRYILVEFPRQMVPLHAEEAIFELQLQRLVPVIAHPERNSQVAADPGILKRLVERGAVAQVTAGSLVGWYGNRVQRAAESLVKQGMIQVIASDAHSATDRPPLLRAAAGRAVKLIGEEAALAMVTTVPAAILADKEIEPPEPRQAARRSWFSILRLRG